MFKPGEAETTNSILSPFTLVNCGNTCTPAVVISNALTASWSNPEAEIVGIWSVLTAVSAAAAATAPNWPV